VNPPVFFQKWGEKRKKNLEQNWEILVKIGRKFHLSKFEANLTSSWE